MTAETKTTAEFNNIVALLAASSAAIGVVEKRERNNTGQGFNFRGIDATSPEFREHGIIVTPETLDRVYEQIEVGKDRTLMGHVMLRIRYTFHGPAGDCISATVDAEAFDSGDKATAKAMSVGLRTALLQVLMLPTDEVDPDASSYERAPAAARSSSGKTSGSSGSGNGGGATESQVKAIFGKAKALGWDNEYLFGSLERSLSKNHPELLTKAEATKMLDYLQGKLDEREASGDVLHEPESRPVTEADFAPPADEDIPF
jgi:hypothetical protein